MMSYRQCHGLVCEDLFFSQFGVTAAATVKPSSNRNCTSQTVLTGDVPSTQSNLAFMLQFEATECWLLLTCEYYPAFRLPSRPGFDFCQRTDLNFTLILKRRYQQVSLLAAVNL